MAEPRRPPLPPKRPEDAPPPPWATDPRGLLVSGPSSVKLALTGGLASGKSTVAAVFEILGAARLDFDLFAREAVAPGGAAYGAAQEIFGPKCLLPDGTLDRAYVGRLAFKDPALRRRLEEAVHPETWRLMLLRLSEPNPRPVTVIEIPLLFEARLDPLFDRVLLTFASPDNQLRRLMFRDPKLRKSQAKRMIASQMPILEKLRRAKMVINNDGPLSRAIYQAKDLWDRLTAPPEAPPGATP